MMNIRIDETKSEEFKVTFVGANGEPWYQSTEGYTRRSDAVRSLEDFLGEIDSAPTDEEFFGFTVAHFDAEGNAVNYKAEDAPDGG